VNTWKVIFATMLIFGTGVVTGGLLVKHSIPVSRAPRNGGLPRSPAAVLAGGNKLEFLRRAGRELDLTPEQRNQVDKIISASQERTRKLMEPVLPGLREEVQLTKEAFQAILTPEQRVRFQELVKQQQRSREQQRSRDQRHPGPPRDRRLEGAPAGNFLPATNQ
jgi:Spy/CpxP family protein refolding chaperone